MTTQEAQARFLAQAGTQGITVLYAGPWDECPTETMAAWARAAQRRAAEQYGTVDAALAQRIYVEE